MADEINLSVRLSVTNGDYKADANPSSIKIDQTGLGANSGIVSVPHSSEISLPVGDVSSEGYLFLRNLDATNFVYFGPEEGGVLRPCGKLKPSEFCVFRVHPSATIKVQSDTATVKLQFLLLED